MVGSGKMAIFGFGQKEPCSSIDELIEAFETKYSNIPRASIVAMCAKWLSEYSTSKYEEMFHLAYIHEEGIGYSTYVKRTLVEMWDYMVDRKADGLEYGAIYMYPSDEEIERLGLTRGKLIQVEPLNLPSY